MRRLRESWTRWRFRLSYRAANWRGRVVLSAGMPRSGSTWLFNAARLLLQADGPLGSGWIGDWHRLPTRQAMLVKVHDFDPFLARHSSAIVYSYRDIRDALASAKRKFGIEPTIDLARHWLESDRRWRQHAAFTLRYESMLADPEQAVMELADALGVCCSEPRQIVNELQRLSGPSDVAVANGYDLETLLHPGHITDGRHGAWHDWLCPELVSQLENECGDWLAENAYPFSRDPKGSARQAASAETMEDPHPCPF